MHRAAVRVSLLAGVLCASALKGQRVDSVKHGPAFWASGIAVGVPGAGSQMVPELLTLGASFARIRDGIGADITVLTIPRAFVEGVVPVGVRLGAGRGFSLGRDAYLVPSVGLVALGMMGNENVLANGGVYAGAALIGFNGPDTGVRVGFTVHYLDVDAAVWQLEIGVVGRRRPKD